MAPRKTIIILLVMVAAVCIQAQTYTTYLWHMDQPVYWGDRSHVNSEKKQYVQESYYLKTNGSNMYAGSSVAHPVDDLQGIFSKEDRVHAYQNAPRDAVNSIKSINGTAGAQVSFSGGLMENLQSLGVNNQWGYSSTWWGPYKEARSWTTSGGFPRLDIVAFTNDHALSPLVSERTLIKEIQAHQYEYGKYYGTSPFYSKGYWPAECAFSEHIIKALKTCGINWVIIANEHLARTMKDYVHPYNINGNIDPPNKADVINNKPGNVWADGSIDGRGTRLAAPFCYQAHKVKYVDPASGQIYLMDAVPMDDYESYVDGYSGASVNDVQSRVAQYNDNSHPSIELLAHDGDNAWGGGYSYYYQAVPGYSSAAQSAGIIPTTIEQFLSDHPVPSDDIVHVEDGAWVNPDNDWGSPQFIKWLWPLYNSTTFQFDPNAWNANARNWAVITATDNYVCMAEDLTGNLNIGHICEGGSSANDAEKAWHFYFGGLNSGFMYYGGEAGDMAVKEAMTGNIAIGYANNVIAQHPGVDHTPPSVFIPQRYPYNPGGYGFGPTTGYKKVIYPKDFTVWTLAYDVSGLASVKLKYRVDHDTIDPIHVDDNKTYAGGPTVGAWQTIEMNRKPFPADPVNDTNFFIEPLAKADLCYAMISGYSNALLDYYVEATDQQGNVYSSPIQHVYVANETASNQSSSSSPGLSWSPSNPTSQDTVTVTYNPGSTGSYLHWGVNNWQRPDGAYASIYWSDNIAARTPFVMQSNGSMAAKIGPFNKSQKVTEVDFTIQFGSGSWLGSNATIPITQQTASAVNQIEGGNLYLSIYPQPMTSHCIISLPNTNTNSNLTVSIVNSEGQLVKSFHASGSDIPLYRDHLKSGLYIVKVINQQDGRVYSSKLLVNE